MLKRWNPQHERQGKCSACGIRWRWQGRPRVRDAVCPKCGARLERTSHQSTLPERLAERVVNGGNLHEIDFYRLLEVDPEYALRDATARLELHRARRHPDDNPLLGSGLAADCADCAVLTRQVERAQKAGGR